MCKRAGLMEGVTIKRYFGDCRPRPTTHPGSTFINIHMPTRKRARAAPAASPQASPSTPLSRIMRANDEETKRIGESSGGKQWSELADLWRTERLDCSMHVKDTFRAHRNLLAACFEFLRGCFCGGLSESESASVTLERVSNCTFEAVLSWINDGRVVYEESALAQLFEASVRLQIASLQDEAERTPQNDVDAWILADSPTRPALINAAKAAVLGSFSEAAAVDSFPRLPLFALDALLSSDSLRDEAEVRDEAEIFTQLKRWVAAQQPAITTAAQTKLLRCVRFAHMDFAFLQAQVITDPLTASSQQNTMARAFQKALHSLLPSSAR